jgi:hypothetical protein
MIDRKYKDSVERSLARMENLSAGELAKFIFENDPPPVGWCMDVYIADGELYTSDYYSTGTIIQYEPDVFVILSLDNRQGDLDPTEAYDIGTNWLLSDKFIEKYRDQYLKAFNLSTDNINEEEMHRYIWEECMTEEEQEEEIQKMTEFYWLGDDNTWSWLQWYIEDATKKIENELERIEEQEREEEENEEEEYEL